MTRAAPVLERPGALSVLAEMHRLRSAPVGVFGGSARVRVRELEEAGALSVEDGTVSLTPCGERAAMAASRLVTAMAVCAAEARGEAYEEDEQHDRAV